MSGCYCRGRAFPHEHGFNAGTSRPSRCLAGTPVRYEDAWGEDWGAKVRAAFPVPAARPAGADAVLADLRDEVLVPGVERALLRDAMAFVVKARLPRLAPRTEFEWQNIADDLVHRLLALPEVAALIDAADKVRRVTASVDPTVDRVARAIDGMIWNGGINGPTVAALAVVGDTEIAAGYYDCGRHPGHDGRHSAFPDPAPAARPAGADAVLADLRDQLVPGVERALLRERLEALADRFDSDGDSWDSAAGDWQRHAGHDREVERCRQLAQTSRQHADDIRAALGGP